MTIDWQTLDGTFPTRTDVSEWQDPQHDWQGDGLTALDRSTGTGRASISGYAPLLVSLLLGVLITAEIARAALVLWGGNPSTGHEPDLKHNARVARSAAIDVSRIVAAHMFGVSTADPAAQDPANPGQSTVELLLVGTLAAADPKQGLAIINSGGRATIYRVGDTVADAALHSVFRDYIVLRRGGILETLAFPLWRLGDGKSSAQSSPSGAQPDSAEEPAFQQLSVASVLRGVTAVAPGGKIRGVRIFPTGIGHEFGQSGLHDGDLVVAINGASLENQDKGAGQAIFNSIKTSSQTTVTVERNGVRRDITVNAPEADSADSADEAESTGPGDS
jgi:type II secretion system protein C